MKKILQVSMGETFGGIEKIELEWLRHIGNQISFDFLSPNDVAFKNYENEIKKLNGNVYNLNVSRKNKKGKIVYGYRLYKFLKKNKYDIIHINSGAFFYSLQVALIAKICKVKKIIVHSHDSYKVNKLKRALIVALNPFYRSLVDEYITCSEQAKSSLFTQKFINKNKIILLKNGIDIDKYKFNENVRTQYRKKYNMDKKVVYGHTGRFAAKKNHVLLIDIFFEIQKKQSNSVLLLVGDGECKKEIEEKVKGYNIENKVIFLGFRDDIDKILNCMDVFIYPSLYEGLGISLIEAQTNGLITCCSKNMPLEANISSNFKTFDLKESSYDIADYICNINIDLEGRKEAYKETIKAGYDIYNVTMELEQIYMKMLKEGING